MPVSTKVIRIVGAGPAGLAAAITLARAGRGAQVHEAHAEAGFRFGRDLQGIENRTSEEDVLDMLRRLGITTDFARLPCREGAVFDARGRRYARRSQAPPFYMVERGPGPGTPDTALLAQALGVEVRFLSRLEQLGNPGLLAVGPKAADGIAVGYHFDTSLPDGFWAICDDELAPKGYGYLLIMRGRGTVKSCMTRGFKQEQHYVRRTVEAFERRVGLTMENPAPHGGVLNARIPESALSGRHPVAGEQAGFQDALWGFGMRYAIRSGVLAARCLLEGVDYDALWRQRAAALDPRRHRQLRALRAPGQRGLRLGTASPGAGGRCATLLSLALPAGMGQAAASALGPRPLPQPTARRELRPRGLHMHLVPL